LKNYYFILGITIYAREAEIKRAYRKMALRYHPDKNSAADAESVFKEINEAYEVLSDPERKTLYDQLLVTGHEPVSPPVAPPPAHRDPRYRPKPPGFVFTRSSKKKDFIDLMQRYLPMAIIVSRIALVCVAVLVLDFILPVKRKKETIVDVYKQYGRSGIRLQASDGKTYKLGKSSSSLEQDSQVMICTSPLLSIPKRLENEVSGARYRIPVSIYGNFIFFPAIWLITSLLGIFYKRGIEFRFNLGVVNLLLAIFNLIILFMSI
jgi:hypothetical protein